MKRNLFAATALILILATLFSMAGCASGIQAKNLMEGITPGDVDTIENLFELSVPITDFAIRLFAASQGEGENTLLSPLSVLYALAMTANGAGGDTLAQIQSVLGMEKQTLNQYLHRYMEQLSGDDTNALYLANSVWFTDDERFTVKEDFLQCNADYYGADIYRAPFDSSTCKDINSWVKRKTNDRIPEILDEIPEDAVMYLVNALTFDAQWNEIYKKDQVRSDTFTAADGTGQPAEFMYGEETDYLEDEWATGFMKYYKDKKYAFVALLPREDISVTDYIASLNGAHLQTLLSNPQQTAVNTAIPKFETQFSMEMSTVLKAMGMENAFHEGADFSGIGSSTGGNIYISRVLHKTYISVAEKGTQAGAATAVEFVDESASMSAKTVYLDRPFVYMLIDCTTHIPFFIGTLVDISE